MDKIELKRLIKEIILEESKKIIYYDFYQNKDLYTIILTGSTFDVKDIIKKYEFNWGSLDKGWKYKEPVSEDKLDSICKPLFIELKKIGITIAPGQGMFSHEEFYNNTVGKISDFSDEQIPEIPNAIPGKNKIYIKNFHHYAPMTKVSGGGTKFIKPLLNYYNFNWNSSGFIYDRVELLDNERKEFIKILKDHNYDVIEQDV